MMHKAEAGCLGKVKILPPQSPTNTSVTSSRQLDYNHLVFQHKIAVKDLLEYLQHWDSQLVALRAPLTLHIIYFCHLSSAGGIPL
jgi:hypothetical protein